MVMPWPGHGWPGGLGRSEVDLLLFMPSPSRVAGQIVRNKWMGLSTESPLWAHCQDDLTAVLEATGEPKYLDLAAPACGRRIHRHRKHPKDLGLADELESHLQAMRTKGSATIDDLRV